MSGVCRGRILIRTSCSRRLGMRARRKALEGRPALLVLLGGPQSGKWWTTRLALSTQPTAIAQIVDSHRQWGR